MYYKLKMADEDLKLRIEELKDELKNTKVNKKTEGSVGKLKAKIAKFELELEDKQERAKGKKGAGYAVKKEGDATIGFLGKPSVGKSTLLSKITNKESKIGAYEFTTLEVIPGRLYHKFANLQILDLPGIIEKANDNRGFGKKVLSVVRACDLIIFMVDSRHAVKDMDIIMEEASNANIRINKKRPFVEFRRVEKGGIQVPINKSHKTISYKLIEEILHDLKIINAEVLIHEKNLKIDDLIDCLYNTVEYKKGVICINKIDLIGEKKLKEITAKLKTKYSGFDIIGISAEGEINLEKLKDFVWEKLDFIWVYLKEQKKKTKYDKPLLIKQNQTVKEVCRKIHNTFVERFLYAKVKGKSVKFDWQRVGFNHILQDKDEIEIFLK